MRPYGCLYAVRQTHGRVSHLSSLRVSSCTRLQGVTVIYERRDSENVKEFVVSAGSEWQSCFYELQNEFPLLGLAGCSQLGISRLGCKGIPKCLQENSHSGCQGILFVKVFRHGFECRLQWEMSFRLMR